MERYYLDPTREPRECPWPAALAARAARRMGLPQGNMWEPGAARAAEMLVERGYRRGDVERHLWFSWFGEEIDGPAGDR